MLTAYIGMGSNIASPAGPPDATLAAAATELTTLGSAVRLSSLYSTEPVGFADQPRFLNAVAALDTDLDPYALLIRLLAIERAFGRDRSSGIRNGPRTLDLDLLLYGGLRLDEPDLQLPHPRLAERGFVLIPLNEITSQLVDARSQKSVQQLLYDWQISHSHPLDAVTAIQSRVWRAGPVGLADGSEPRAKRNP